MKCPLHRETIVDLARGVAVAGPVAEAAEAHVSECAECRAVLARERELSAGLEALAASTAEVVPPAALEGRVMAAFDAQRSVTEVSDGTLGQNERGRGEVRARSRRGEAGRYGRVLAAAASLAIVTGIALSRLDITSEHPAPPPLPPARLLPEGPVVPSLTSVAIELLSDELSRPARPPQGSNVERVLVFHPIPGAGALPAFESARILRTEMPVEALPAYGVEIMPDALRRRVVLDLLVGQDGFARGVRVVPGAH